MHVLHLTEHLLGFYDGRAPGAADEPIESWVEDGALSLGICSYALVDGGDAIVYDTHVSLERARLIRETIERGGYLESLIDATEQYVGDLLRRAGEPIETQTDLRMFVADQLAAGSLTWFAAYQRVHESNLSAVANRG